MPAGESKDRAKTRERFNEVFKKYSDSDKKKSKKKRPEAQEEILLQTLKKRLDLEKPSEQEVQQNTYDPEQESRFTKNQIREELNNSRNQETSRGKRRSRRELPAPPASPLPQEEREAADPQERGGEKGAKRKSKKGKGRGDKEAKEAEDKLLQEYQLQIAQQETKTQEEEEERSVKPEEEERRSVKPKEEEEERRSVKPKEETQKVSLNNDVGKKKKKKLKSVITQEAGDEEQDADVENEEESKEKKKKKKKKHVSEQVDDLQAPPAQVFDDSLVLGVFVHRTDGLQSDLLVSHPMVKVHVVEERSGKYLRKEDSHRPVSSFYEQQNVEHVLPIITQPFDFKKNKSIIPEWREQIIFNERFGYFLQEDQEEAPRVILFFEILDFMTMEEARANAAVDPERGFRKIAWAFLKLVGTNGVLNIDSKLRLQLFCPPARAKRTPGSIEVFEWWSKFPRNKYSSTLYVTVKGIALPEHVDPCMRSMMALQEERGSTSFFELQSESTRSLMQPPHTLPPPPRWSRLPGQVCRIPNRPLLSLRGGQYGCLTLQFSHSGTKLAAACADRDSFPVIVYEIPSGKALMVFSGHLKIVYDLCWSSDDCSLLSASSDGTVREWRLEGQQSQKVLPHPSFVYCAQYHPAAPGLVLTGGFDTLLRLWRVDVPDVNGQLLQEVEGHRSFINSLCFDATGRRMFSADNSGLILVWKTTGSEGKKSVLSQRWVVEKEISESDLLSVPINKLQLHPNGRCLLIHARDSVLRMMDLRILAVKRYIGATNYRERLCSTFTPCGSFLFSGSEDGMAYVWNTDTGDQLAVYSELSFSTALHGVCFHPHENMVAFSAFGQEQLIHLYLHDRTVSQLEGQSLKASSRSSSADPRTPPAPPLQDSMDQLILTTRLALKMQSVKLQLDSVLEPPRSSLSGHNEPDKMSFIHSGRSFTPDSVTTGLNSTLPPPSFLSPHAKLQISGSVAETLIPQASLSTQQRGCSPVGQRLRGASRLHTSVSDRVSARGHVSAGGHASAGGHETESADQQVVSLYDYRASRSDELTLHRGDKVQVLYRDNENRWFGRLSDGQQGYFLSSYVSDQRDEEGAPAAEETERKTPTRVSAAISSSGELRFLSETNDTEPETQDTRVRRKKRLKKAGLPASDTPQETSRRRGRSTDSPLAHRHSGHSNAAFTPDT